MNGFPVLREKGKHPRKERIPKKGFFKQGFRSSRIRSILSTHRQQQQQIEAKRTLYHNNPHLKSQQEEDRKQKKRRRRRRGKCGIFHSFFSPVVPEAFE
jgi:hypothetical protein